MYGAPPRRPRPDERVKPRRTPLLAPSAARVARMPPILAPGAALSEPDFGGQRAQPDGLWCQPAAPPLLSTYRGPGGGAKSPPRWAGERDLRGEPRATSRNSPRPSRQPPHSIGDFSGPPAVSTHSAAAVTNAVRIWSPGKPDAAVRGALTEDVIVLPLPAAKRAFLQGLTGARRRDTADRTFVQVRGSIFKSPEAPQRPDKSQVRSLR